MVLLSFVVMTEDPIHFDFESQIIEKGMVHQRTRLLCGIHESSMTAIGTPQDQMFVLDLLVHIIEALRRVAQSGKGCRQIQHSIVDPFAVGMMIHDTGVLDIARTNNDTVVFLGHGGCGLFCGGHGFFSTEGRICVCFERSFGERKSNS